jgi:pimeloyl-ACP methyl ester carboxylesterase
MAPSKSILVLHGITMSGASMRRTLGPLGPRLEGLGYELIAPNGGHRLNADEVSAGMTWMSGVYDKRGQNAADYFRDGRFWHGGEHYDWFDSATDADTGNKTYRALEQSLENVAAATQGRHLSGVLGFSQGAAMAMVLLARAAEGDPRFQFPEWALFLSGFKPVFHDPRGVRYPIAGRLSALFVVGEQDPVFPGSDAYLRVLGEAFAEARREYWLLPGLAHDVPTSPEQVERFAQFIQESGRCS